MLEVLRYSQLSPDISQSKNWAIVVAWPGGLRYLVRCDARLFPLSHYESYWHNREVGWEI